MRLLLKYIFDAAPNRPPGYVEEIIGSGVIVGDELDIEDVTYRQLVFKYRGEADGCCGGKPNSRD